MSSAEGYKNLLSHVEKMQKSQENQQKLLDFLYTEKYSMILKDVLGIKTRAGICKILSRMKKITQ